jgi:hypothetical protein
MLAEEAPTPETTATERRLRFCDAAKLTVGLAATALPFARSHSEQAERWLRLLRVNGAVGNAMQGIGLPEYPLIADALPLSVEPCQPDALSMVIESAARNAQLRGADAIATEDVFVGVLNTYGPAFDQALAVRGTTSAEVLERMQRAQIG